MTKIGIDFDNTIVFYDDLFHKIATEEKLIPSNFPTSKVLIRDYLRKKIKTNCLPYCKQKYMAKEF